MRTPSKAMMLTGAVAVVMLGAIAPVTAESTEDVASGHLDEFAAGIDRGYEISGPVRLKRGADWTEVKVNAQGLPADEHVAHLHENACDDELGGGHYKNDPTGPGEPPNELWLTIDANASGNGHDRSDAPWQVRDGDRSVVVHDEDGARIACADLPIG